MIDNTRISAIILGHILNNSRLLDDLDRPLSQEDFTGDFRTFFTIINNLYFNGCEDLSLEVVSLYLSEHPHLNFDANTMIEIMQISKELCSSSAQSYDYYYHKLKKISLLKYYDSKGLDTKFIYNDTIPISDPKAEQEQLKFDRYTEKEIVDLVNNIFVTAPTANYCTNTISTDIQAANGMNNLIDELMSVPDIGVPLNNDGLNTVTRGARKGCIFMRSAIQGGGKSRMLAGDICKSSVPYFFDTKTSTWEYTGFSEPSVYFTTEMTPDEIQTLFISAVSKVDEEHILYGEYKDGELERVRQAIEYIKSSPIYIVHIPDFSINDIKNLIKKYHYERSVDYFFFDYVHTSLRLMAEINSRSGIGLKEHQLLLVFITELKSLAQEYNIFIFTASQLNAEAATATYKDQNLLAGAKALANKLDVGIISMRPNKTELKKIEPILHERIGELPNMCHHVYKVRRGRLTRIIIWTYIDLGTMTEHTLFATNFDFELIEVDFTKIETDMVEKVIKEHSIPITMEDENTNDEINEEDDEVDYSNDFKVVF